MMVAHLPDDRAHGDGIEVVIPPRSTAVPSGEPGPPTQRDRHLAMITEQGRLVAGRDRLWPTIFGRNDNGPLQVADRTSAASPRLPGQQTEAAIGVAVLNRMLAAGRPDPSVASCSLRSNFRFRCPLGHC